MDSRPAWPAERAADLAAGFASDLSAALPADLPALRAAARIAPCVRRTPLFTLPAASLGLSGGYELWLKLEQMQVGGSFKARGMFNRMLAQPVPAAGVVIASGGNAGIAAAAAARALGQRCTVFLPQLASPAKRAAVAALGAQVVVAGAAYADALAASLEHQRTSGALLMHAYDQPEVLAGAGTLALEIAQQGGAWPGRLLVSVGGGGLVAGIAEVLAATARGGCRVEALEPVGCPTLNAALAAGRPVDVEVGGLAADALGARRLGELAWPVCRAGHAAGWLGSHLLEPDVITEAQRCLWRALRLAVEPAAALPLAALHSGAVRPAAGERVALVICGANLDPSALS